MSLKDALKAEKQPVKSKFVTFIDSLDQVDRDALLAAATDPGLSNQAIVRAVATCGYTVNKDTVAGWRRGYGFTR